VMDRQNWLRPWGANQGCPAHLLYPRPTMSLWGCIIVGLFLGAAGRLVLTGYRPDDVVAPLTIGVAGAVAGGLAAIALSFGHAAHFLDPAKCGLAGVVALVSLAVYGRIAQRRRTH